ncbi:MAG: hypothetical protein HC769_36430 [Cyanobacteria bacterium CRU_2_1]|nr:hypothetical protein [Cyanobacteria bacterium CRU_2_1]
MNAEIVLAILAFIAFTIPIVGSLWRIFSIREKLNLEISELRHNIALNDERIKNLIEQQELAINGLKEVVAHVRTRTQIEEEKLSNRVADIEGFLAKSAGFAKRNHGKL